MTYSETLDYLFARLPMFSRTGPAAIKPDLTNTIYICNQLNNPEKKFRSVHIAGTNGKGSCSHMLAAVFQSCGYKTGLYTSPHLHDFRERILINGEKIPKEAVINFTNRVKNAIDAVDPSFFEITVAMAFDWFAEKQVDVAVIETGLGGRLDSTNVITPVLSVITNIGMDHTNLLGESRSHIATEKAGIIKPGVPAVIGESNNETDHIFRSKGERCNAPLSFAEKHWRVLEWQQKDGYLYADIMDVGSNEKYNYKLDLPGHYQLKNLITVLESISQLIRLGFELPADKVIDALKRVKEITGLHGRWETIQHKPQVVLDVAHNEDGIRQVVRQLQLSRYRSLHIVIGIVKDKDADAILGLLPTDAAYYFTQAKIPRALPATDLMLKAEQFGLKGTVCTDVNTALKEAIREAASEDLILVCGSVFTVGEVFSAHT